MISLPMIDGRQRMTRFEPIYAEQKLPKYVPASGPKEIGRAAGHASHD